MSHLLYDAYLHLINDLHALIQRPFGMGITDIERNMMMKKREAGATVYDNEKQQDPYKLRNVLFSREDGKIIFLKWIWTPSNVNKPIVFDERSNQFVFAYTNGWYPFHDSIGNVIFRSVFVLPDNFDLVAAKIIGEERVEDEIVGVFSCPSPNPNFIQGDRDESDGNYQYQVEEQKKITTTDEKLSTEQFGENVVLPAVDVTGGGEEASIHSGEGAPLDGLEHDYPGSSIDAAIFANNQSVCGEDTKEDVNQHREEIKRKANIKNKRNKMKRRGKNEKEKPSTVTQKTDERFPKKVAIAKRSAVECSNDKADFATAGSSGREGPISPRRSTPEASIDHRQKLVGNENGVARDKWPSWNDDVLLTDNGNHSHTYKSKDTNNTHQSNPGTCFAPVAFQGVERLHFQHSMDGIGPWRSTSTASIRTGQICCPSLKMPDPERKRCSVVAEVEQIVTRSSSKYTVTVRKFLWIFLAWICSGIGVVKAGTTVLCTEVNEHQTARLNCPSGAYIDLQFAAYGNPSGTCEHYSVGTCNSDRSDSVVRNLCQNKNSCQVLASYDQFRQDPCPGAGKKLIIQALCRTCPAGQYLSSNPAPCSTCPSGTYSSEDSASCSQCPAGKYSSATGSTSSTSCNECSAGKYAPPGSGYCSTCPAGTFSSSNSSASCSQCPAGKYAPPGSGYCSTCTAGTFSSSNGSASCSQCPAGKYLSATGSTSSTSCNECSAGKYAPPGSGYCSTCPAGTFSSSNGLASCDNCLPGYSSVAGSTFCDQCSAGKYSAPSLALSSSFSQAPSNGLQLYYRFDSVSGSRVGNIANGSVVYDATLLNSAAISNNQLVLGMSIDPLTTGTDGLTFCSWWKSDFSGDMNNRPSIFSFAYENGLESVGIYTHYISRRLTVSYYTENFRLFFIMPSVDINTANTWKHVAWTLHPSGTWIVYINGVQLSSATSMPYPRSISRYNNDAGIRLTIKDFRMYSRVLSATEVETLFISTQTIFIGASQCVNCLAGKYSPSAGSASCPSCPAGQYSSRNGSLICDACAVGKYAYFSGSKSCKSCESNSLYSGLACFDSGYVVVGCFEDAHYTSIPSSSIAEGTISDIHSKCEDYAKRSENLYPVINYRKNKCDFSQDRNTLNVATRIGCLTTATSSALRTVFAYSSLGYVSVGCFVSPYSLQSITLTPSGNSAVNLINKCATAARDIGYSVFAMSGSDTCYGGIDISAVTKSINNSGCSMVGNKYSKGYQVYINPSMAYSSLGCFNGFYPSGTSRFVVSEGTASYDVNSCGAMAVVQSKFLFGFSNSGSICFVGDETAQVVNSAYTQNCDISNSFKIYVQTVSLFPQYQSLSYISPQSMYQNIGCYRDSYAPRVIPTFQTSGSSPVDCALKAENENFQAIVFGLQNGGECWTGDSVSFAISLSGVVNCPLKGSILTNQVFVRKFCFPGLTTVSTYTGNVLTFACRKCSTGHYCPGDNTEVPCAMDYSTQGREGSPECTACDTANGESTIGLTGQPVCKHIPVGFYLINSNTTLKFCGTDNKTQHWIGGGYNKKTCRCALGYTGDLCDFETCTDQLPQFSLGNLLFNSDSTLLLASQLDIANTLRYLYNLLSVSIDVTGDGIITTDEMLNYLKSRSVYSTGMETFPLWYDPDKTARSIYGVAEMYREAYLLYQTSPKHKFDGSGLTFMSNLTSIFPNPSWDDSKCDTYDVSRPSHKYVETSWKFVDRSGIKKVCGYINGFLSSQFQTTKILVGNQTHFTDTTLLSKTDSYKRVYCVYVYSGSSRELFECSVGLFYDGTPIDLNAQLTTYGIVFSYLDTSTTESKFDIFVGDYNSPEESKQFVVGIPYASQGCGRTSTHISFVDNLNRNSVGALLEYGVRAVQIVGNATVSTAMTVNTYRIPFFVQVAIMVKNTAGKGIANVIVSFCHIDPDTAVDDLDPSFCPVLVLTTDKRGLAVGTIRVSSPLWANQLEQFNVTATYVEEIITGQTVTHVFSPPSQILTFSHTVGVGSVNFQDVTKIRIYGQVFFDPKLLRGASCPFANVPVNYLDFSGTFTNTTSGADGKFNFMSGYREFASIYIPDYLGNTWRASMMTWKNYQYQTISRSPTTAPVGMKPPTAMPSISFSNINAAKSLLSTTTSANDRPFPISLQSNIIATTSPSTQPIYDTTALPTVRSVPQVQGLMFKVYNGYFNDETMFFNRELQYATGYSDDFSSITSASGGYLVAGSGQSLMSIEWFGYLLTPPGTTGVWTIALTSDDSSFIWLGDSALTVSSTSDSLLNNNGVHAATTKVATKYLIENSSYPIRIQYGQFVDMYQLVLTLSTPHGSTSTGRGLFYSSPTPTAAPSTAPTFSPSAVTIVGSGLYFKVFQGYFGDDINFFALHNNYAEGFSSDFSSLSAASNGYLVETNTQVLVSIEWFGYLQIPADRGGLWNFTLSSDDSSIMWLGDNAVSEYTLSNAFISNIGVHSWKPMRNTMILMEAVYYPIRIQYGQYQDDYNLMLTATSPDGSSSHGNGILFTGAVPTTTPSMMPSFLPSRTPTAMPIIAPSRNPTVSPTTFRSAFPTLKPISSQSPSVRSSSAPSVISSVRNPTAILSITSTRLPTLQIPTVTPSRSPASRSTSMPSTFSKSSPPITATSAPSNGFQKRYPTVIPTSTLTTGKPTALKFLSPSKYPTTAPNVLSGKTGQTSLLDNISNILLQPSSTPVLPSVQILPTESKVTRTSFPTSDIPIEAYQARLRKKPSIVTDQLKNERFSTLTNIFSTITNLFSTASTLPSIPSNLPSTETLTSVPNYFPPLVTSVTYNASVVETSPVRGGLMFSFHAGIANSTNSTTGYSQRFGSIHSATANSICNFTGTNISILWTGYIFTPDGSTGSWTFWSVSDGAVNVWINGIQIISGRADLSSLLNSSNPSVHPVTNSTTLKSYTPYPIHISYQSDNPQKLFQLFFTSPISKVSSDFSKVFYYSAQPLILEVPTVNPTTIPTEEPIFKPSRKPVTAKPSRIPTAEPTLSSNSIRGLLFNVYSANFNKDTKHFAKNVPYLAGFTTDLSTVSSAVKDQVLLQGDISIEWFGYLSTQSSGEGQWSFTINSDAPGFLWIGKNAVSGYVERNAFSFDQTNTGPFTVSLFSRSYVPIRIQVGSSSLNLFKFTFKPPGSPHSLTDGDSYFMSIRPVDISVEGVTMMHEYLFDNAKLNGNILSDVVGNLPAYKPPTVSLKNGKAMFDNPSRSQYIQLHPSILLFSKSFSIELWAEFASSNNPSSTLFSFGPKSEQIYVNASFNKAVYIAVVYSSNTSSVYVDGVLTKNSSFSYNGFSAESIMGYNFIGRNALGSGSGMSASIEAIRIWYGELTADEVFSNHITGFKSSSIVITEDLSLTDITVTYYATTMQEIEIGFFGGNTTLSPMFGPETTFLLSASDPQCPYSTTAIVNANTSTATVSLSAMNYSVTIQTAPPGAPLFDANVCDRNHSTTSCYCTASKPALQYLEDANRTTQNIVVTTANATVYDVTYIYESGICFEVVGSEDFSLTEGDVSSSNNIEYSCFDNSGAFLAKGSNITLHVSLFSRYPIGAFWIEGYGTPISLTDAVAYDYNISNSLVFINDQVSGAKKTTLEYSTTFGLSYTITAGFPRPSAPFSWLFSVLVTNYGLDGISSVFANWYVVVLGVIPKEVPNFYPVATNPDMIFLVLRDPPGGASSVTIAAGSTFDFGMSLDGAHTYDSTIDFDISASAGFEKETDALMAPMGFGVTSKLVSIDVGVEAHYGHHFTVSASRASNSHYEYSFNFQYDFSTSSDPFIAGSASDVIIGGGVDLVVNEAIEVARGTGSRFVNCARSFNTFQWQPGKITTFVLPVVDIEALILRLTAMEVDLSNPDKVKISKQIKNWNTVLSKYRDRNSVLTDILSVENSLFSTMLRAFSDFNRNGGLGRSDFIKSFKSFVSSSDLPARGLAVEYFDKTFNSLEGQCSVGMDASTQYLKTVCSDFDTSKSDYLSLKGFLSSACDMPGSPQAGNNNPLKNSDLMKGLCKEGTVADANDIPGGLESSNNRDDLMGFMKSKEKYLTFSSNAPVTLAWTSTVSDSISSTAMIDSTMLDSGNVIPHAGGNIAGWDLMGEIDVGGSKDFKLTIGQTSDSSHEYTRTITIQLNDDDFDDYFVIRITEDSLFGTPVFTTMGGQSKCPGETATSRRESQVSIVDIVPRCGPTRDMPCDHTLNPYFETGMDATYGIVIQNLSPTEDLVHYAIVLKPFDEYHSKGYQTSGKGKCGTPGQLSGIQFSFPLSQDLSDIPYNKLIEVPFTVSQSLLCDEYVDLEVQIVSACEMGMDIFQYGITNQKVDYSKRLPSPSSSTGTFSVRWPSAGRRKLSPTNNQSTSSTAHSKDLINTKYEIASLDDVLTRSQTDFMNKLLVGNENSKVDQKELMQKLLAENEERMLRLLADIGKINQTELMGKLLAENEERMLRLLADSTRRVQVELASYVFAGLFILMCIVVGIQLIFFSETFRNKK